MIKVKSGVSPKNLIIAAALANESFTVTFPVVITSGTDGTHMKGSKHYTGEALDMRTRNFPEGQLKPFMDRLQTRLGEDYQLILEVDHLHIEYDPPTH